MRAWPVVLRLGTAQTLAWASSYYLFAILAAPMAREPGLSLPALYATFSAALVVSAVLGPWTGRLIDRHGGRGVLMASNLVIAAGLALLALAPAPAWLVAGWLLLGAGMALGLYEAAFAALVRLWGQDARNAITGITLLAGFASTVGWPVSTLLEAQLGWRGACGVWAVLHLVLGLPLNARLPRLPRQRTGPAIAGHPGGTPDTPDTPEVPGGAGPSASASGAGAGDSTGARSGTGPGAAPLATSLLLAWVFAVITFTSTAVATHLPQLLVAAGSSLVAAVAAGALIGPAQVAGRLLEFGALRRLHPLIAARAALAAHPLGVALVLLAGAPAGAFALLHGLGNGILTIAKGTLPLALFGAQGYGARQGLILLPARLAQAAAPMAFGLALAHGGAQAAWLTAGLSASALLGLLWLRAKAP